MIEITLNGESVHVEKPLSLVELLMKHGIDPTKVAVERNLEIVPKSQYAITMIDAGDRLEVVHFIGGG